MEEQITSMKMENWRKLKVNISKSGPELLNYFTVMPNTSKINTSFSHTDSLKFLNYFDDEAALNVGSLRNHFAGNKIVKGFNKNLENINLLNEWSVTNLKEAYYSSAEIITYRNVLCTVMNTPFAINDSEKHWALEATVNDQGKIYLNFSANNPHQKNGSYGNNASGQTSAVFGNSASNVSGQISEFGNGAINVSGQTSEFSFSTQNYPVNAGPFEFSAPSSLTKNAAMNASSINLPTQNVRVNQTSAFGNGSSNLRKMGFFNINNKEQSTARFGLCAPSCSSTKNAAMNASLINLPTQNVPVNTAKPNQTNPCDLLKQYLFVRWPKNHYRYITSTLDPLFYEIYRIKIEEHEVLYAVETTGVNSNRKIANLNELSTAEHLICDTYFMDELTPDRVKYNPFCWSKAYLINANQCFIGACQRNDNSLKEIMKISMEQFEDATSYENIWSADAAWSFLNSFLTFVKDEISRVRSISNRSKCIWKFETCENNDVCFVNCLPYFRSSANTYAPVPFDFFL